MIDNPVKTPESLLLKDISYVLNLLPQNIKVGTFAISRSRAHWSFQTAAAFINTIKEEDEEGESEINPFAVIVTTIKRLFSKVC